MSTNAVGLGRAVADAPLIQTGTSDRLHALDAVRGYALLLGVVLHSAAAFLQDFPMSAWTLGPGYP